MSLGRVRLGVRMRSIYPIGWFFDALFGGMGSSDVYGVPKRVAFFKLYGRHPLWEDGLEAIGHLGGAAAIR